jgi:lipid-A-disaccharide synthase-like uncharacterized protein
MNQGIGYFFGHIASVLQNYINGMSSIDLMWIVIGLAGQCLFMARFIVQWIHSERHGKSVIPLSFWYLSLGGGMIVLAYGLHKLDPIIILGQLPGTIIYIRNLVLLNKNKDSFSVAE